MPTDAEKRLAEIERFRAERADIESAARCLRYEAVQGYYAGFHRQEVAYGFAALLDTMALRWRYQDEAVKRDALSACTALLDRIQADRADYERRQASRRS